MVRVLHFLLPVVLALPAAHLPARAGELAQNGIAGLVLGASWSDAANKDVHAAHCVPAPASKTAYTNAPDRMCFVTFATEKTLFGEKLLPDAWLLLKDGKLLAMSVRMDIGPHTPPMRRLAWLRSFTRFADLALHAGEREFLLTDAHAVTKESGCATLPRAPAVLLRPTPGRPTMDLIWGSFEIVLGSGETSDLEP